MLGSWVRYIAASRGQVDPCFNITASTNSLAVSISSLSWVMIVRNLKIL